MTRRDVTQRDAWKTHSRGTSLSYKSNDVGKHFYSLDYLLTGIFGDDFVVNRAICVSISYLLDYSITSIFGMTLL